MPHIWWFCYQYVWWGGLVSTHILKTIPDKYILIQTVTLPLHIHYLYGITLYLFVSFFIIISAPLHSLNFSDPILSSMPWNISIKIQKIIPSQYKSNYLAVLQLPRQNNKPKLVEIRHCLHLLETAKSTKFQGRAPTDLLLTNTKASILTPFSAYTGWISIIFGLCTSY
jgi:hypothetical protein